MTEEVTQPLKSLFSNENIAIATLAIMVAILAYGNFVQWKARMDLEKLHRTETEKVREFIETLINNFRGDMKNAWSYIEGFAKAFNEASTDLKIIRDRAERRRESAD